MADKKCDILEFVEQSNFEQFTPTHTKVLMTRTIWQYEKLKFKLKNKTKTKKIKSDE